MKRELASQATHAMKEGQSESPVSIAATLESLRETGNLDKIALADVLSALTSIQGAVDRLNANQIALEKRQTVPGGMFAGSPTSNALNALHPTNALAGLFGSAGTPTASTVPTSATMNSAAVEKAQHELDEALKKLIG